MVLELKLQLHLSGIFSRLKDIRSSLDSPLQEGNNETNTPRPDKGPNTQSLEIDLLRYIFTFSMSKFKQRLLKRKKRFQTEVIPNMQAYAAKWKNSWTREEGEDYQKFEKLLTLFAFCFRWADLPSAIPIIEDIAYVVTATAMEWRDMIVDEGDTSRLTCWEREIASRSQKPVFPLRRYLSKVFLLSYHFESLLKNVAYSFRMGPVLNRLVVKTIEPILMDYSVNVSELILRDSIAHSVLNSTIANDTMNDVVSTTMDTLRQSAQFDPTAGTYTIKNSRVHCEVLLLRYHLLNPDIPPFNYFAVSKLCCYPCYALFHAYNESVEPGEHKYFTKGCHNKIYPFWPLPDFGGPNDSRIRSELAREHFALELTLLLKNRQSVRALSDNTDASGSSTDPICSIPEDAAKYDAIRAFLENR